MFRSQYLDDRNRGWLRFKRTLCNKLVNEVVGDTTASTAPERTPAKFLVAPRHHGTDTRKEDERRLTSHIAWPLFDQYHINTFRLLKEQIESNRTADLVRSVRSNHTAADHRFIHRLMNDPTITIKPADKNLGMVLVDTSWYEQLMKRMLRDTVTYRLLQPGHKMLINGKIVKQPSLLVMQKQLHEQLLSIIKRHESTIHIHQPLHAERIIGYLTSKVTPTTCVIPTIYLLIKVHKPSGLSGRPIVPSTQWITSAASVVVDHLLQHIFTAAKIAWIVKDTKSLISELESTVLPACDGVFVTADIASLYTNIDTITGLKLVREFLHEQKVDHHLALCIMDLLTFVMENSYLQFQDTVYHQIDGAAMGSPCAPVYANIFVYMLERKIIQEFTSEKKALHCFKRYLDDIWSYIDRSHATAFQLRLNQLHSKLKFDFVQSDNESAFLDLLIFKGQRFHSTRVVDLRCHQKKMNLYLYIPWHSFHPMAAKRSFIQTELMRYIRNSSAKEDYLELKHIFFQRLRDRGYPITFLNDIFDSIHYCDRSYFLMPATALLRDHIKFYQQPPQSQCLIRKIKKQHAGAAPVTTATSIPPSVFIIPYSPLSASIPTRDLLCRYWSCCINACSTYGLPHPIIAYQSLPSLCKTLVFARAMMQEKERKRLSAPPALSQTTVSNWLQQPLQATAVITANRTAQEKSKAKA